MSIERYFSTGLLDLTGENDKPNTVSGVVTRFGQLSSDRGGYRDKFAASAFSNLSQKQYSVKGLFNHDENSYLGRTDNGTLKLFMSDDALRFELELPDTTLGRDVAALIARKDTQGMSFGYIPDKFTWSGTKTDPIRCHDAGELVEVSIVYDPSFKNTVADLHSLQEPDIEVMKQLEQLKEDKYFDAPTPILNCAVRKLEILRLKLK